MANVRARGGKKTAAFRFAMCLFAGIHDKNFYPTEKIAKPGEGYRDLSAVVDALQKEGLAEALETTHYPQIGAMADFIVDNKLTGGGWKFKQIRIEDTKHDAYTALILAKEGRTEIFFPGTPMLEWKKWAQNLAFSAATFTAGDWRTKCKVHSGFLAVMEQIRAPVELELAALEKQQDGMMKIGISGYSQGGAVAPLFALGLKESLRRKTHVYTFAAPRVGLEKGGFVEAMDKLLPNRAFHFRADHDPVPRLPLRTMSFANTPGAYIGIGTSDAFADGKRGAVLRNLPLLRRHFSMSAGGEGLLGLPTFHFPLNYLQSLLKSAWHTLDISTSGATTRAETRPRVTSRTPA